MDQEFFVKALLVIIAIALIVIIIRIIRLFWTALSSRNWPRANGVVVSLKMDVIRTVREDLYVPGLIYRYRVDGKDYEGSRINLTSQRMFYTHSAAHAVLEDYKPDRPVAVYYNPNRPEDALLKPGVSTIAWAITVLIIILIILLAYVSLP